MIFDANSPLRPHLPSPEKLPRVFSVDFSYSRLWPDVAARTALDLGRRRSSQPPELLLAENAIERVQSLSTPARPKS